MKTGMSNGSNWRRFVLLACLWTFSQVSTAEQYWTYTVRPGDSIWSLTEKHCTSVLHWKRIQRINGLPDEPARGVLPGTRLKFPIEILKHQPASAHVRLIQGTAQMLQPGKEMMPVSTGVELKSGDRVLVDRESNLTIRFADGSELVVLGGSEIVMDSLSAYGETGMVDTRVRLQNGRVDTRVKPSQGPGSRYEIITPAAVAAVRGTDFRVAADTDLAVARNEVIEGIVEVAGTGTRRNVPAGFGVVTRVNQPPEKPRPLLPPPDLSPQAALLDRLPLQFHWEKLKGSHAYRYQVASSSEFDSLLADDTSASLTGFWPDLPDGNYVLRVRGIDEVGLEGLNAQREFTVAAHPEPPVLIGLHNKMIVRDATPEFGWSKPQEINHYRFQLASEESFSSPLVDHSVQSNERFTPGQALVPGSYHWRLASIDSSGKQGPFSDISTFEYRSIPDTPDPEKPALGEDEINFHWRTAGANMQYQFQLDSNPEFIQPSIDRNVSEPHITIATPSAQTYFFRVRAIDVTGYAGPWSTTQSFTVNGSPWWLLAPIGVILLL